MIGRDAATGRDRLVRMLYGGSVSVPADSFAAWALQLLQSELHCSGLCWEVEDSAGNSLALRSSGVASVGAEKPRPASRHIVRLVADDSGLLHRIGFFFENESSFDALDAGDPERLCGFLLHAEQLNQQLSMRAPASDSDSTADNTLGIAVVSIGGHVLSADRRFHAYVQSVWPEWDGLVLPFTLDDSGDDAPHRPLVRKGLVAWAEPQGDHVQLRVRFDRRKSELSAREHEIASRVAKGLTFREIGAQLNVAPSTVSSHLYNLYTKLGISRRAELVEWLSRREGTFREG